MRRLLLTLTICVNMCCTHKVQPRAVSEGPAVTAAPEHKDELKVEAAKHSVPKLTFSGEVTKESARKAIGIIKSLPKTTEALLVVINSPGGSVDDGLLVTQALENFRGDVVCIVDGEAASEAFYILQGCLHRFMTRRSTLMAHEPFFIVPSETHLTRRYLAEMLDKQNIMAHAWTAQAGRRLKMTVPQFRKKIRWSDWTMTDREALDVGAVDGVIDSVNTAWATLQSDLTVEASR